MGRVSGMEISTPPKISPREEKLAGGKAFLPMGYFKGEVSILETHGPFGNCIPVRVNQVIKFLNGHRIYRLIQEYTSIGFVL